MYRGIAFFCYISTHTLTWSVTTEDQYNAYYESISTHTLTWSVTNTEVNIMEPYTNFNSHAHVERDPWKQSNMVTDKDFNSHAHVERDFLALWGIISSLISTHTLTWSVTLDVVYIWCLLNVMRTYFFI